MSSPASLDHLLRQQPLPGNGRLLGTQAAARVFLATPHLGTLSARTHSAILGATNHHRVCPVNSKTSLLAHNFNALWCTALNLRGREPPDYFCMLHADVGPQPAWLDTLVAIQRQTGADVLSVVIPQKHTSGLTSTGLWTPNTWDVQRLTLHEVHQLPATFGACDIPYAEGRPLVVNTGLMLVDFRKPWVEEVCFTIQDKIRRTESGQFEAVAWPEDWNFSAWCHSKGLKVLATRAVTVAHVGELDYGNDTAWGAWQTDQGDGREE